MVGGIQLDTCQRNRASVFHVTSQDQHSLSRPSTLSALEFYLECSFFCSSECAFLLQRINAKLVRFCSLRFGTNLAQGLNDY